MVKPGVYHQRIDHYVVLRTVLDMLGLAPLGASAKAQPIDFVWEPGARK
jgi:acid phosphatase